MRRLVQSFLLIHGASIMWRLPYQFLLLVLCRHAAVLWLVRVQLYPWLVAAFGAFVVQFVEYFYRSVKYKMRQHSPKTWT
jgi:hypothetical protein